MSMYDLKKVVAVCFLDATKSALDHLGKYRIELSNQRVEAPRDLTSYYGDVRRLRDYLHCRIGASSDVVRLELDKGDRALLVACAIRAVEALDLRLETGHKVGKQERDWLESKRRVLSNWAVEFAEKPLVTLPLPRLSPTPTRGVRDLAARVHAKVHGPGIADLGTEAGPPTGRPRELQGRGLPRFGSPLETETMDLAAPEGAAVDGDSGPLLDPRQVRDPRLRTLVTLDLRAYERAREARDHRLACVHLASILEGAMLDHALPRRSELGLVGSPDNWNPQEILIRILGQETEPKDRMLAHQVFTARNLVRPMIQLLQPTVVTPSSLLRMAAFVREALRRMGFRSGSKREV